MFLVHRAAVDPLVVSWIGTALAVGYAVYVTYRGGQNGTAGGSAKGGNPINLKIKKDTAKVVDNVDVEDLGNKAVFCRCWRSKKFPYCDGAHGAHNEATGDNVGPLIVNKYQKQ